VALLAVVQLQNRKEVKIIFVIGAVINTSVPGINEIIEQRNKKKLLEIARMQIDYGAKMLAINCGTRFDSESDDIEWMFRVIQDEIEIPLCIDSPNPEAHKAGLKVHRYGRPMVNSITAEKSRIETIMPLAARYNAMVVAILHDEDGMPKDVTGRLRVVPKIRKAAKEYGVKPEDIFLDCMIFPLSVNHDNGQVYLNTLKAVKEKYPEFKTICGLNNISYGLPQPELLNQTFLTMCAALGQEAVFIETTKLTRATFKAIQTLLGKDNYSMNYLKAYRNKELGIFY
jgi:cobalamin-dependent methionine synthase I